MMEKMANKTVGEYIIDIEFNIDLAKQKKMLDKTVLLYQNHFKKQFRMAERLALTHGSAMAQKYQQGVASGSNGGGGFGFGDALLTGGVVSARVGTKINKKPRTFKKVYKEEGNKDYQEYKSGLAFWKDVARKNPNDMLAQEILKSGRPRSKFASYKTGVKELFSEWQGRPLRQLPSYLKETWGYTQSDIKMFSEQKRVAKEQKKFWKENSKQRGIFGVQGQEPWYMQQGRAFASSKIAKYGSIAGGAGLVYGIGKAVLGGDPTNSENKLMDVATFNTKLGQTAKRIGMNKNKLYNYDIQGQNAGLKQGAMVGVMRGVSTKFGGSGEAMLTSFLKASQGQNQMIQDRYAQIMGIDPETWSTMVEGYGNGIIGKPSSKSSVNFKSSKSIMYGGNAGRTTGQQIVDQGAINLFKPSKAGAYASIGVLLEQSIINANKSLLKEISAVDVLSKSKELSTSLGELTTQVKILIEKNALTENERTVSIGTARYGVFVKPAPIEAIKFNPTTGR